MQIPETISRNTIAVYAPENRSAIRKLDGEDLFEWRKSVPDRLSEISLNNIAKYWEDNPLLEELTLEQDTRLLLDALPTDLPLALTVSKIDDEIFWRRCYQARWPNKLPVPQPKTGVKEKQKIIRKNSGVDESSQPNRDDDDDEGESMGGVDNSSKPNLDDDDDEAENMVKIMESKKQNDSNEINSNNGSEGGQDESRLTWKRCFLEMHVQEKIENLKPEEYNPQEIKSLVELCRNYVKTLKINQMLAPMANIDSLDRVPLRSIISGLSLLTELKICYKQTYAGENFNWHIVQTTTNDIRNLAAGLKNCNLTSFSLINSDIDCDKFITLSRSLLKNTKLRTMDLSHCKISDKGMTALCRQIRDSPYLESVNMTNNSITKTGAEIIAFTIHRFRNRLKRLYLDLNKIGVEGGDFLAAALTGERCVLETLTLPGCGLTRDNFKLVEVLKFNEKLKVLDLSNNRMGEDVGDLILEVLEWNDALEKADVRMCGLSPAAIFAVQDKISLKNRRHCGDNFPDLPKFDEEKLLKILDEVFPEEEEEEKVLLEFDQVKNENDGTSDEEQHVEDQEDEEIKTE